MTNRIIELARIKLAEHSTEADLQTASTRFQNEFLSQQEGFIRRDMVRHQDRSFTDIILWESRSHADAVFERAQNSEIVAEYFSHMHFDPENPDEGVEHCELIASYQA